MHELYFSVNGEIIHETGVNELYFPVHKAPYIMRLYRQVLYLSVYEEFL